jgi:hypothetical protein
MEEAPENGKKSSHSAHASGMNEWFMQTAWELGYQKEGICYSSIKRLHICVDCNAYKPLIFKTKLSHFIWPFLLQLLNLLKVTTG